MTKIWRLPHHPWTHVRRERRKRPGRCFFTRPTRGRGAPLPVPLGVGDPAKVSSSRSISHRRSSSRLFGLERILSSVASSLSPLLWSAIPAVGRSSSSFTMRLLFLHCGCSCAAKKKAGTWKRTLTFIECVTYFNFFLSNYMALNCCGFLCK